MLEDMHEAYFNVSLTAVVPATVRLSRTPAHAILFRELFNANTDKNTGHAMMRAFQRDVKRLSYDGVQTLQMVFYSRTAANKWQSKALRLQKAVIILRDTQRAEGQEGTGLYTEAQLELQYAVRVYGCEKVGLAALARAFATFAGAKVLDVEYARATRTNIYDNRYHTIRFAQQNCPEALQGVSMIKLDDTEISVHHFQQNLRRPCTRCYSSRYGTMRCTLAVSKLAAMKAKSTRVYTGKLDAVRPPPRAAFQVGTMEELLELLMQHQPKRQEPGHLITVDVEQGDYAERSEAGAVQVQESHSDDAKAPEPKHDAEGFFTKETKRTKAAKAKAKHVLAGDSANTDPAHRGGNSAGATPRHNKQGDGMTSERGQGSKPKTRAGKKTDKGYAEKDAGKAGKAPRKITKRFEKVQRVEALGQYSALAMSDSDESDSDGMEIDETAQELVAYADRSEEDDAPYAFPEQATEEQAVAVDTKATHATPNRQGHQGQVATKPEFRKAEVAEPMDGVISNTTHDTTARERNVGRVATKAKTSTAARSSRRNKPNSLGVGLPDGAIKGMQSSMASYVQKAAVMAVLHTELIEEFKTEEDVSHGIIPATPDSQDELIIGETRPGTLDEDGDLPIKLGQWLVSFHGREVAVATNGQCAFLATLASKINHAGPKMMNSEEEVKDATDLKWSVYTLMMANLRKDVELHLVDPKQECARLHPEQPQYTSVQDWDAILAVEEQQLHEEYGLDSYAASSQPEQDGTKDEQAVPLRYARAATGDTMNTSCFRILRDGSDAPMDEVDRPLADLMTAANAEAFRKWSQLFRKTFDVPTTKRRAKPADIRVWLLTRMTALRHYFAFLPYPEHEAKSWTLVELEVWGRRKCGQNRLEHFKD
ncbi:hypothetical protein PF004_g16765 [Phytophthora fragariae]|uniref:Uncharacterized protein n=1 Tax=Phytophthora fragariae TaxID=53985 RepID=A0A6G0NHF6_9STRA|nr:hypothetical protein PF004_g16765 [Phytophthora fragariae]